MGTAGGRCERGNVFGKLVLGELVDSFGDAMGEEEEILHLGVGNLNGDFLNGGVGRGVHLEAEREGAFSREVGGYIALKGAVDEGVGVFGGGIEVDVGGRTLAVWGNLATVGGDGDDGPIGHAIVGIGGDGEVLLAGFDDEMLAIGDSGCHLVLTTVPGLKDVPSAGIVLWLGEKVDVAGGEMFPVPRTRNVGEVSAFIDGDEEFLGDETGLDEAEGVEIDEDDILALDTLGVTDDACKATGDDFVERALLDGKI